MVDVFFRVHVDRRQFARKRDQGSVELCLLLGLDPFRLSSKLPGSQDGRDAPPEALGGLALPQLIFGILHGHMFSRDFL